jgi:hypothetical protein
MSSTYLGCTSHEMWDIFAHVEAFKLQARVRELEAENVFLRQRIQWLETKINWVKGFLVHCGLTAYVYIISP